MYTITAHASAIFEVIIDHAAVVETGHKRDQDSG